VATTTSRKVDVAIAGDMGFGFYVCFAPAVRECYSQCTKERQDAKTALMDQSPFIK
jgi:hypothetical protein